MARKASGRPIHTYQVLVTLVQLVLDALVIFMSFRIGFLIRNTQGITESWARYALPVLFSTGLLLVIFWRVGLYRVQKSLMNVEEFQAILKGAALGFLIMLSLAFFLAEVRHTQLTGVAQVYHDLRQALFGGSPLVFSRQVVVYSFLVLVAVLYVERYFLFKLHQFLHQRGLGNKRVLICGAGPLGGSLIRKITLSPKLGYYVVAFVDKDPSRIGTTVEGKKVLGPLKHLERIVRMVKIDLVLAATQDGFSEQDVSHIIAVCRRNRCGFEIVPGLFGLFMHRLQIDYLDGVPLVSLREPRITRVTRLLKRAMDLVVASSAVLVTGPLMLIIAAVIRRQSPGGAFFRQKRVGQDGRIFLIWKFRTMYADTPRYAEGPSSNGESRITPIGRWLRRYSLDELPQLFNVLAGDMSIVGPRPEMPFIVDEYSTYERERLRVKPGITGLWQVSRGRGENIHTNIDYDIYYVEHLSLLLDVVILAKTVPVVLAGRGV